LTGKGTDSIHHDPARAGASLDERAWFGISDFEILQYDPSDTKKPFRFEISFRNSGKTPARQINELESL